jgi:hypothetical protein
MTPFPNQTSEAVPTQGDTQPNQQQNLQLQALSSTLLPVQGMAFLVAPLCYLHEHPADVYRLFRSMYARCEPGEEHWQTVHLLLLLTEDQCFFHFPYTQICAIFKNIVVANQ